MKLTVGIRPTLTQTLTPQQIQYLKLLQLPVVQLEQQVLQELETNPMLELASDFDEGIESIEQFESEIQDENFAIPETTEIPESIDTYTESEPVETLIEDKDPFEFQKLIWQDDYVSLDELSGQTSDDEDYEPFQIKDNPTFLDELRQQLRMLELTKEEFLIGEHILGNIDEDGYLRRPLEEIVEDVNSDIRDINFEILKRKQTNNTNSENPAKQFALSTESVLLLHQLNNRNSENPSKIETEQNNKPQNNDIELLNPVDISAAEKVLSIIQQLDPPGIGSRNIQECLLAQCKAFPTQNPAQKIAYDILSKTYDAFTKKHYHIIIKELGISQDELKNALDFIRRLNPKPGLGDSPTETNTIIPDFIIEKDYETNELKIIINDSHIPPIKLNTAYEKLKKEIQYKNSNKETKEWIRAKYEDAKFMIQAIQQRRRTMLKVMTAIAYLQKDFFYEGVSALKPLIYKDVANQTGLDISTICRIVNGKYVQTEFGTFELKFFFSESLPTEDGDEVAAKVVKEMIKEIIDKEPKNKPYSDDKITKMLQQRGYKVARRTVAKYRDQLKIPVARLRKELQ